MKKDYSNQLNKKLIVKEKGRITQIDICDILYIECENNICRFVINNDNKTISTYKVLKEVEQELSEFNFFRANRNTLVNLANVRTYSKVNQKPTIELINNKKIIISKNKLSDFFKILRN